MITNTNNRTYDVIEITNEMPLNRIGGVGSVIENLIHGFNALGVHALWFLVDHNYHDAELDEILTTYPSVAVGSYEELEHFRAPVVHLHSYNHNPQLLEVLTDKRTVFTIHSLLAYEERSNAIHLPGAVRWQEALIAASQMVILISEAERRYYDRLGYRRLNSNRHVIHNGISPPPDYRVRRHNKVLGFCGRLVPRKRPEYVQMILKEEGFEDYTTMIAGKGFSTYARDLVRDLGIESRVRYLGWCSGARLETFYDRIDVLAVPSIYEPFGMAALEAAVRGVPIVCNPVDGLIEILGDYAFYTEDNTYAGFRAAMYRWLRADETESSAMATGARSRCEQHFTDVVMAEKYLHSFETLERVKGHSTKVERS